MDEVPGTRTFRDSGAGYDTFMGRYSKELAPAFADVCVPAAPGRFLDVGCGPGALTGVAVARLGAAAVAAVDPTPGFVRTCQQRYPGVDVREATAEALPFGDDGFDGAAAQLVLHFVTDPQVAVSEMARVVRPGGVLAAAVWDFTGGMQMLRAFWDAALSLDSAAPHEAHELRFGSPGELAELFSGGGLQDVAESTITVASRYDGFDELWEGFLRGIGPAGAYAAAQPLENQARLRTALFAEVGRPEGGFSLDATARIVRARTPG